MSYNQKIKEIVRLVRESKKTLALTGAGISTESGIPDYRSPGTGLWEKHDPAKTASLSALRKDPARFYSVNLNRWIAFNHAKPNAAHYALTQLEKMGLLTGVITQNIDSLHVRSGAARVWEVHGHLRTCHCMECRESYSFDYLVQNFKSGDNPPRCAKCKGVLRPDVVLFEDRMNEDFYQATQVISGCQLMLVAGSSLTVYPVAGLPGVAKQIVIINRTPTPYDEEAAVVVHENTGQAFQDIMAEMSKGF
ncbi:SIR2 family NAD-dependent protein deacylase [Desulfoscipio gibsoniae]|uniref:protein acetyllysine N-acetyltransferase n=1 Tax=Desulfoscipio gibsoniae DSM 7213 TaxID=767817 RepID=R4KIY0_9FIRM|nr:Sir2 family NAD-dependent protein deacetylase [Desulfoscipio gibsoniae]AGL01577.1 NAD-dependent protein deacetylase, SIR2 family [Desulfoscipio gibsoniae DSM 7213]